MASTDRQKCTHCHSATISVDGRRRTIRGVCSHPGNDELISVSEARSEASLRETIIAFGCSGGRAETAEEKDFEARFQLLVRDIRRDFDAVDTVIKVMEKKLNNLEKFLHSMQRDDHLQIVKADSTADSIRLAQVAGKCDQILRRLDYIEGKFAPIVGSKNVTQPSYEASRQMLQISDSLKKLSSQIAAQSSDISVIKNRLAKNTSHSHSKSVSGSETSATARKLVNAKIIELNPKQSISSASSYRSVETPSSSTVNSSDTMSEFPHQQIAVNSSHSTSDDKLAYLRTRLKDPKIMNLVRAYITFLHNQPTAVLFDGMTSVSAKMLLSLEGLPVEMNDLKDLYIKLHEASGISKESVLADLETYRSYIATERIQRLQRARETTDKFYGRNSSKPKDSW